MEDLNSDRLARAKKRVEEMKGFYIHAAIYTVINAFILVNILIRSGYDGESFWQFGHFFTPFFWGIGLLFHASKAFRFNPLFNEDWEKKKIRKYMEEYRKEAEKFTRR